MIRILLVRHGETEWNALDRVQGHSDSPLNNRGRDQARALADRLARIRIDAVYSSDLSRAVETIMPFAERAGLPVVKTAALREKGFGEWEGLDRTQIESQYPDIWQRYWIDRDPTTPIPGGETWPEVSSRIMTFVREIVERHQSDATVVVAGHGGSLRPPILHVLGAPLASVTRLSIDNCSITTLSFTSIDDGRLLGLNDHAHIEGIE